MMMKQHFALADNDYHDHDEANHKPGLEETRSSQTDILVLWPLKQEKIKLHDSMHETNQFFLLCSNIILIKTYWTDIFESLFDWMDKV